MWVEGSPPERAPLAEVGTVVGPLSSDPEKPLLGDAYRAQGRARRRALELVDAEDVRELVGPLSGQFLTVVVFEDVDPLLRD